ncbi:MAG: hypothetical protein M1133_08245, partial [Armatimonadetes bacterium]|nr:hypothetical protein [Armatimonadota bacterium]
LIIGAVLWSSSTDGVKRHKVDVEVYPAPMGSGPWSIPEPPAIDIAGPPAKGVSPAAPDANKVSQVEAPKKSTPRVAVKPQTVGAHPSPISGMFPMGNVVRSLPEVEHRFRQVAELFPSFVYAGRMWTFTGQFAYSGQVDLAPTGVKVGDRNIYALTNTQGPGSVLFVQSARNPEKYAVYR